MNCLYCPYFRKNYVEWLSIPDLHFTIGISCQLSNRTIKIGKINNYMLDEINVLMKQSNNDDVCQLRNLKIIQVGIII